MMEPVRPNDLYCGPFKRYEGAEYDIEPSGLPKGATYRREEGTRQIEVQVGTGTYEKVLLDNPGWKSPVYPRRKRSPIFGNITGWKSNDERGATNYVVERPGRLRSGQDKSSIQAVFNKADGE